jgi:hypothetical protein
LSAALCAWCVNPVLAARSSRFTRSCAFYQALVRNGADANERIYVIDRILRTYPGPAWEIPLTQYKIERNFLSDWKTYLRQSAAGMPVAERRATLDTITRTYQDTGVNLAPVAVEYARLPVDTARHEEPVLISTTPAHQEIIVSSPVIAAIAPEQPAPVEPRHRTAKYVGFSGTALGGYGLYGYQMLVNLTDRFSLLTGMGTNTLLKTPNALSTARAATTLGLVRYGENIYIATGLLQRTTHGEAVCGTARTTGTSSCSGIPVVIGVETGNKRGIFLSVEWAYVAYYGGTRKTLSATDPATAETAELELEAPANSTWFGIGLGLYLF